MLDSAFSHGTFNMRCGRHTSRLIVGVALFALALIVVSPLAAADSDSKEKEPPEPVNIKLKTKDPVVLKATYYEGTEGKESVPVVLIHMSKGKRTDYRDLALLLQSKGFAVLVPDLRGHGDSTAILGSKRTLDAAKLPARQYAQMVFDDMEAVKSFLLKEHNDGKLNIEKLCVVGAEMGAAVAVNWALLDWSWPPLAVGKQGQDVRGLVLISPRWAFKTLQFSKPMADQNIRSMLAIDIIVGKDDSKSLKGAKRIYKAFEPYHPDPEKNPSEQNLFLQIYDTSLQGTNMLGEGFGIGDHIAKFIELLLAKKDIPWKKRELPL